MAAPAQFRTEHLAATPAGYRVRSIRRGSHVVRVGFPPGPRKKGAGKVLEILHPKAERNSSRCIVSQRAKANPSELLIFGNPSSLPAKRAARERAARIRAARLNPDAFDSIRAGSRVTFVNRFGQRRTGRAVMPSSSGGWVLNMGGPYGTPQVVHRDMVVKVTAGKRNPKDFVCPHCNKEFTAKQIEAGEFRKHMAEHRGQRQKANPRRRRRDRNPNETEQAVRLFETFHGRDARGIIEKHVSAEIRRDYTTLGDLIYLKVKTPIGEHAQFSFDGDGVKLACSPNGKQLYCIGGRQNLLPLLDGDSQQKDFLDLGECIEVAYLARKIHSNFEPIEWFHKFGEKAGSTKPQLMFDKLKRQIFFVGGEYYIDPNVDLSPGIEN